MTKRSMAALGLVIFLGAGCAPSKKDVAVINGQTVTEDELSQRLLNTPTARQMMQQIIVENLVMQEAKKKNITVTDEEVNQLLKFEKEQLPPGRFDEQMLQDTTEAALKERLRVQTAMRKLAMAGAKVDEKNVEKFYKENETLFVKPDWKQVGFIVTKDAADAKKAVDALKQGVDFEKAYQQFDSSPTKGTNPDWQWFGLTKTGFVSEGRQPVNLPDPIKAALKKLEAGKTSDAIALDGEQRVIIKLNKNEKGGAVPLAEVKDLIAFQLAQQNSEIKPIEELLQGIVKEAKVEIKLDRFKDLEKTENLLGPQAPAGMPVQ